MLNQGCCWGSKGVGVSAWEGATTYYFSLILNPAMCYFWWLCSQDFRVQPMKSCPNHGCSSTFYIFLAPLNTLHLSKLHAFPVNLWSMHHKCWWFCSTLQASLHVKRIVNVGHFRFCMLQLAIWWHAIRMLKSVQSPNHESRPLHSAHFGNAPRVMQWVLETSHNTDDLWVFWFSCLCSNYHLWAKSW